jgi:uncharacterized protein with ParB-like and HNH nuclease domain/predicted transport protein
VKASENSLANLLQTKAQFTIPIYQRTYSWTTRQCELLWSDILKAGQDEDLYSHFLGSIVYITDSGPLAKMSRPTVIDGQQRLTTVTLLMIAIRDRLQKSGPEGEVTADDVKVDYLINVTGKGDDRYKLQLTQNDRLTLNALLDGQEPPVNPSQRVLENYRFFRDRLITLGNLEAILQGVQKLTIVEVSLDAKYDNPQLIFESMNSTGLALSQADLIRNFVLMGLDPDQQDHLYTHFWRKMEQEFGQANYLKHFDSFMRHYLTLRTGAIPTVGGVYQSFKDYAFQKGHVESIVPDISRHATYFTRISLGHEPDPRLSRAFADLAALEVNVAIPFLLEVYEDYDNHLLSASDFELILRLVESYIVRRTICDLPSNALNKIFLSFSKSLRKERYVESVQAKFRLLAGTGRYPNDGEFLHHFAHRDFYNLSRRRNYLLEKLTNHDQMEKVVVDSLTIEHILPQNPNLSEAWRNDLGPEWKRVQDTWLHTIGNLTLTGYNSSLSDSPFLKKRDMPGGFADSPISLSMDLKHLDTWNEDAIVARGERLAKRASTIWQYPSVSDELLEIYKEQLAAEGKFVSPDVHFEGQSPVRKFWENLRLHILNTDPSVTEEVFKTYIAYKGSTNFVDIAPQKSRLVCTLNIDFDALDDPREWCRDVSAAGKWGNGDAQFAIDPTGDVGYAMSLIHQAFEFRESGIGASVTP